MFHVLSVMQAVSTAMCFIGLLPCTVYAWDTNYWSAQSLRKWLDVVFCAKDEKTDCAPLKLNRHEGGVVLLSLRTVYAWVFRCRTNSLRRSKTLHRSLSLDAIGNGIMIIEGNKP